MTTLLRLELIGAAAFIIAGLTLMIYSVQNVLLEPIYEELGILCESLSDDFRLPQETLEFLLALCGVVGDRSTGVRFTWETVKLHLGLVKKAALKDEISPPLQILIENTPSPLKAQVERAIQLCSMVLTVRNPILLAVVMWRGKIISKRRARAALLRPIAAGVGEFRTDFERFIFPLIKGALAA